MYKVWCVIVGIALFLPLWVLSQPSPYSAAGMMAAMRDKSRPLLIFYPQSPGERPLAASLIKQRALFDGHEAELKVRDVVLLFIPLLHDQESVTPSAWSGLRRQFQIDDLRFTVVLVGKDGGEKFRSHVPVKIEKLDALIDAMPMRQQEVRDGHHPE
jgi:hypothetical protein